LTLRAGAGTLASVAASLAVLYSDGIVPET
jgi:hypothetical protein